VDVIEIDAASHTGVDHMRQLTEQVQFLPVEAKCKVYIIDEVHMLSTGAFNALLKTLEEPPKNVLFILATTELNKIPATIQSRSQTLHFRLLDADQIKSHVSTVCEKESFSIEPAALNRLVQVANGGMRDALSLLDQLMSISSSAHISLSDITELLGSLDESEMMNFLSQCFDAKPQAYHLLKDYLDQGMDLFQLYDDIVCYLHRELLVNESHSFSISNAQLSVWLHWFCDQITTLKNAPTPGIAAQVALYSKIHAKEVIQPVIVSAPSQTGAPRALASNEPPQPSHFEAKLSVSSEPKAPMNSEKPQKQSSVSLPEQSSDSKAVCARVLATLANEFQVLKPVLSKATLLENDNTLCLVLEETYQFFQKKLNEEKFRTRFLGLYNDLSTQSVSKWLVTSDVNHIYQTQKEDAITVSNPSSTSTPSKTINQIIEMFEGQVIK
jgi:DNA polymerase-3 subunit gamma/tau